MTLATVLPPRGHRVVLVERPVAGSPVAAWRAPAALDLAWEAALAALRERGLLGAPDTVPLVVGGRSAGARVACRTCAGSGARAVLALAFPLHPPGRPDRDRSAEAGRSRCPCSVVQGERDPFGSPQEVRHALPGRTVVAVPFADHGMATARSAPVTQREALARLGAARAGRTGGMGAVGRALTPSC